MRARGVLFVFVLLLVARDSLCQDVAAAEESPEEGATLAKFFPAEPEQEEPAEAVAADGAAVEAPTGILWTNRCFYVADPVCHSGPQPS